MTNYWQYFKYVCRHKWYVFQECWKLGVPLAGITHDMSKFLPDEFIPYARYFNGPRSATRTQTDFEKMEFDVAWRKHQRRSSHHWQAWLLHEDSGELKTVDIPDRYWKEMVADWRGAGRMFGNTDTLAWYTKNKDHILLSPFIRPVVEYQLAHPS